MIKKTITFENFLGEKETEDFYFNMSKGELVILQMSAITQRTESLQDKLEKIGKSLQGRDLVAVLDEIILNTIGQKTTDGKKFIKNDQIREDFKSSGAWSELVVELLSSADAMGDFINGLMPANLRKEVDQTVKEQTARERSQAQLQGHKPKQEAPKPTVQSVPELPTVIEQTAEPVLISGDANAVDDSEKLAFEKWKAQQAAAKEA